MKLQESKNRYFISIPKELVLKKKWKKGQELLLILNYSKNIEIIDAF